MPTSCHTYEINAQIDISSLRNRLTNNYKNTQSTGHLNSDLETDVINVSTTPRGIACTLRYDIAQKRGSRPGMSDYYRDVKQTPVRFTQDHFILVGTKKTGRELSEIVEILNITPDDFSKFTINQGDIINAAANDSQQGLQGTWDGIDADTDVAQVFGDVDQSSYANDFKQSQGDITYMKYESQNYTGNVGLSANQDSAVFWTNSWTHDEMEDYIHQYLI